MIPPQELGKLLLGSFSCLKSIVLAAAMHERGLVLTVLMLIIGLFHLSILFFQYIIILAKTLPTSSPRRVKMIITVKP